MPTMRTNRTTILTSVCDLMRRCMITTPYNVSHNDGSISLINYEHMHTDSRASSSKVLCILR